MVSVVDEDVVIWTTVDHLATASLDGFFVTQNCSKQITHCHFRPCVVLVKENQSHQQPHLIHVDHVNT